MYYLILQEESSPVFHLMSLVGDHPFIVATLGIEETLLQRPQLQSESWTEFPQLDPFAIFVEIIEVVTEENVITLIMESSNTAAFKFWVVVKHCTKHAANSKAQSKING